MKAMAPTPTAMPTAAPTFNPPVAVDVFELLLPVLAAPALAFCPLREAAVVEGVGVIKDEVKELAPEDIAGVCVVDSKIRDTDDDVEEDITDVVDVDNVEDSDGEEDDEDDEEEVSEVDDGVATTVSVEIEGTATMVV